jgi:Molecular chaperone GrpE (heat shock protein)
MDKKTEEDKTQEEISKVEIETSAEAPAAEAEKSMETAPEEDELAKLQKKYDELNDKYLRAAADFENTRKRLEKDKEAEVRRATERMAADFLDVSDNFDRALKATDDQLRDGLEQIQKLYVSILEKHGIKPMNTEKGTLFDPNLQEAIVTLPSNDLPEGSIIDVAVPGYMIRDKVLRHAKVVVSSKPE